MVPRGSTRSNSRSQYPSVSGCVRPLSRDDKQQSTAKKRNFATGTKKSSTQKGRQPSARNRRNVSTVPAHRNGNETSNSVRKYDCCASFNGDCHRYNAHVSRSKSVQCWPNHTTPIKRSRLNFTAASSTPQKK